MTANHSDETHDEPYPRCIGCNNPAVARAPHVDENDNVHRHAPVCSDCYTHPTELDADESFTADDVSLITTPADDVYGTSDGVIIDHGPGNQSRLRL